MRQALFVLASEYGLLTSAVQALSRRAAGFTVERVAVAGVSTRVTDSSNFVQLSSSNNDNMTDMVITYNLFIIVELNNG